jgi:hypothetical protein
VRYSSPAADFGMADPKELTLDWLRRSGASSVERVGPPGRRESALRGRRHEPLLVAGFGRGDVPCAGEAVSWSELGVAFAAAMIIFRGTFGAHVRK